MGFETQGSAVDFSYLEQFMRGDRATMAAVLTLFRDQAVGWSARLDPDHPDWPALLHNMKGTSRGVGARALGDACERAEAGGPIGPIADELAAAVAAIDGWLAR